MERYNLRDRNMKMSPTVTSTSATSSISTPTEVTYLGLENIEGGWLADQAARDAARLSTEDAPSMFGSETGVIATPIGTPEIEEQRPDLAQQPTSSPKAWGIADVMDTPRPVPRSHFRCCNQAELKQRIIALIHQHSKSLLTCKEHTYTTNFQNPAIIPFYTLHATPTSTIPHSKILHSTILHSHHLHLQPQTLPI